MNTHEMLGKFLIPVFKAAHIIYAIMCSHISLFFFFAEVCFNAGFKEMDTKATPPPPTRFLDVW